MSLSLLDNYMASVSPAAVALVRLRRGFGSKIFANKIMDKWHTHFTGAANDTPWSTAISELEKLLQKSAAGLPISIVLSNQLVRYKIIPALPPFSAADKVLAVARHGFRETYGDMVDDWTIRVNPVPHGDSVIASAVDSALLAALEALTLKYGCKLKSIQPYLMSGFNQLHRRIKTLPACYVQIENGRLYVTLIRDGAWHSITGSVAGPDWPQQLSALIAREMLLAGWPHEQAIIYLASANSPEDSRSSAAFMQSSVWKTLPAPQPAMAGYAVASDQAYAMALSVAR